MSKPTQHRGKWRIRWYDEGGVRRSRSFVNYREAERALHQRRVDVEQKRLGVGRKTIESRRFSELAAYQLAHHTVRKRSPKDDESMLGAHLTPFFGKYWLQNIGVEAIDSYTDSKRRSLSPKTINNHLTLLGTMLRLAVDMHWLETVPRIHKLNIRRKEFDYLVTLDEMERLLDAAREEAPVTLPLYATALYTGCRAGELFGLHWSDVHLEGRTITIRRSFNKPPKNNRIRSVPILDPLLPILRGWRHQNPLPLVFPNQVGKMHTPSPRVCQEIFQNCLERAGLPRIRFHDLRHTFAAQWVLNKGDIYRLQKILGHSSVVMTERYAHLAPHAFAEDYGRFGTRMEGRYLSLVPASAENR